MKQEIIDIAKAAAATWVPWAGVAWWSSLSMAEWLALIAFVLQTAYLVRKWWREESEWGMRLKRWSERHGITRPAPLESRYGVDD